MAGRSLKSGIRFYWDQHYEVKLINLILYSLQYRSWHNCLFSCFVFATLNLLRHCNNNNKGTTGTSNSQENVVEILLNLFTKQNQLHILSMMSKHIFFTFTGKQINYTLSSRITFKVISIILHSKINFLLT